MNKVSWAYADEFPKASDSPHAALRAASEEAAERQRKRVHAQMASRHHGRAMKP